MRIRAAIALACLLAALSAAGCGGRDEPSTPTACLQGKAVYMKALTKAPGQVRLEGTTPISECLVENQPGGDLATVGEAMVETAIALNYRARGGSTAAALQVGYLVGAAQRGASDTEGIHAELIRRLTVAARFTPTDKPLSVPVVLAYKHGVEAGHADG